MKFLVEAYVWPRREAHVIRSAEDMDAFVDSALVATPENDSQLALLYVTEGRPFTASGFSDHEFGIGLNSARKVGSLSYWGPTPEGTWYSKGERVNPDGVTYAYYGTEHVHPADTELPLDLVKRAAREFLESGGERPAAVEWQPTPNPVP